MCTPDVYFENYSPSPPVARYCMDCIRPNYFLSVLTKKNEGIYTLKIYDVRRKTAGLGNGTKRKCN
jgi:hypothetical protein